MQKNKKNFKHIINNIAPAVLFSIITGLFTALFVILYKFCAKYVVLASGESYSFIRNHLYLIPIVLGVFLLASMALSLIYNKHPNIRGGGIPTSFAILRGLITFTWFKNLFGVFIISLFSFFIGLPLCTEGPAVLMGTSIGRGVIKLLARKHKEWDRYIMTGGAVAGFSVATGAPVSGVVFVMEEAHQKISPMIIFISFLTVGVACVTGYALAPLVGVSYALFEIEGLHVLQLSELWIPLVLGVIFGFFAIFFLKLYRCINWFQKRTLQKLPRVFKIFIVLVITFGFGLWSSDFLYSGHTLLDNLFLGEGLIYMFVIVLLYRTVMTLFSNTSGLTGGLFMPVIAIGGLISAIFAKILINYCGLSPDLYLIIIILGVTACVASIIKTPITAVVFAVEVLACYQNILPVILVSGISFAIVQMFRARSITEEVIESRIHDIHAGKKAEIIETSIVVQKGAFVIGKQVRDIFFPNGLFISSVKHNTKDVETVDEHGENEIREGDVLNIRYSTYNEAAVKEEMQYLVGTSDF